MNGYNFTERVRHTLAAARERAWALGHEYVCTEHILLALMKSDGVGAVVLTNLYVDLGHAAELVMSTIESSPAEPTRGPDAPYSTRSKKVLELSMREAREMNHSYVGTEHLLLGLLGEGEGVAAKVLHQLGVTLQDARQQVLAIVGQGRARIVQDVDVAQRRVHETTAPPKDQLPTAIEVTLRYSNGAVVKRTFTNRRDTAQFLAGI
ncbi:MAG TPA: Clp protease N-terminal domain-containing protein [Gemmatimonadaceae bacterium]|nr:Clp protease N-terminal domain-containing protein [Gemmatimonadaceae bacterium]